MKRAALYIASGIMLLAGISCSNKFLEENEVDLYGIADTLFLTSYDSTVQTTLQTSLGDHDFTIYMQPKFLSFNSMHGKIENGSISLDLTVLHENTDAWQPFFYAMVLLDVEDVGLVGINVVYTNYRNVSLYCSPTSLTFTSPDSLEFILSNNGYGLLTWQITAIPEWLAVSRGEGTILPGSYQPVTVSVLPHMVTSGQAYSGSIKIGNNSGSGYYTLPVYITESAIPPADADQITSLLTDAEYHHNSGIMAICTKSPNQLILLNTATQHSDTIPLQKTPNCISFSEDGQKAVIGYSVASVGYFDVGSQAITAEYNIDCIPYDIVLGDNEWCYITPAEDQWEQLRSLNLSTGELYVNSPESQIYEKTIIKKIPGKPVMAGTQTALSPSGLLLFDLSAGKASDLFTRYHESIDRFWISKDTARLYAAYGNVYLIPEYDGEFHSTAPPVYGNIGAELFSISALDDCLTTNSVFAGTANIHHQTGTSAQIFQFNATNLNKTAAYTVKPVWLNISGSTSLYYTYPRFLFVNNEGTVMYVLKSPRNEYGIEGWFMETIDL
jgi:hypothetical protein